MGKSRKNEETAEVDFSKIASVLAQDHESLFVINEEDDSYVEYSVSGSEHELVIRSSGEDFFSDLKNNVKEKIHPDDQDSIISSLGKHGLQKALKKDNAVILRYRLLIKGKPCHYALKATRISESSILIAIMNIEDSSMKEKEAEAGKRVYAEVLESLASLFEVIFIVNVSTGHYTQYSSSSSFSRLGTKKEGKDFFEQIHKDAIGIVHPSDKDMVLEAFDRDNLVKRLQAKHFIRLTYRQMLDGQMQYVELTVLRQLGSLEKVVVAVSRMDDRKLSADSQTVFTGIANALAGRYETIYMVNLRTDEYMLYSGRSGGGLLENGKSGEHFFAGMKKDVEKYITPDDRELFLTEMQKDTLLENLSRYGSRTLAYRQYEGKKIRYKVLFAVLSNDDPNQLIITVSNVDAAKRKAFNMVALLDNTIEQSDKDMLTNVRNKRAYVFLETELDRLIASEEKPEFSIVTCDINDLKKINETKGHEAGDEAIIKACDMICSIFEHSPVFRTGGDEFAVVLRDRDYEKRESLISNLLYEREKSQKQTGISFSYGISDYDPDKDMRVADVFKRADRAMRENKKQVKNGRKLIGKPEPVLLYRDRPERFAALFEELIRLMTDTKGMNTKRIEEILGEIAMMFRLTKGVTCIYRNARDERKGKGETLCSFDRKVDDAPVCTVRYVSSILSIAVMTVYMPEDIEPLSDEELEKVKLVMSAVVSYVSRNRMRDVVDRMAFYDDDGYRNYRSYSYYMMEITPDDRAVAYYNIRQLGIINSEYGRKNADLLLKKHYNGLKDMIGDRGSVFRLGGDTFLAVFGQEQVNNVASYLTNTEIGLDDSGSRKVKVSSRAGICIVPSDAGDLRSGDFVGRAAMAYKTAKDLGEAVSFYDETMTNKVVKVDKIRKDFPGAIEREEFKVYYQPKVDINTGEMVGAESLCRWIKNGKLIPPAAFIEVLERSDDICRLDYYMLEHVCMDLRRWLDEGRKCPRVSVNFSRRHMADKRFDETITQIVDKYGIPRKLIEIELTETTTDVEFADLKRVVAALQKVGMYTAVDDFGIGYSSLRLIKDIPWNILKVDKSFLPESESDQDENVDIMYRSVVKMTRELGIECVTEGVETVEQVKILRENGCDIAQGYLYDKPLPVDEFETRLDDHTYEVYD
ncbi:MAG: EAL domain-containing protein [Lachnospiraceae bacterium]|nr:EAL domain-containing protein [Lachnospiraceae bacterium]